MKVKCKVCGIVYKDVSNLHRHGAVHSGIAVYSCDICGQKFTRSDKLRDHEREVHEWGGLCSEGEETDDEENDAEEIVDPNTCACCKTGFNSHKELEEHQSSNMCRPFPCPLCSRSYSTKERKDKHMKMVHNGEFEFNTLQIEN